MEPESASVMAGTKTVSVVLPISQRSWLVQQAAARATATGGRVSVSEVVRSLVDRAQRDPGRAA